MTRPVHGVQSMHAAAATAGCSYWLLYSSRQQQQQQRSSQQQQQQQQQSRHAACMVLEYGLGPRPIELAIFRSDFILENTMQ